MAKKKAEEFNLTFRLANIELLELNILRPIKALEVGQPVHFNIGMEQRFDIANKVVFVASIVSIIDAPTDGNVLARMATSCNFVVENLEDYVKDGDKVELPEPIMVTVNSIAISTTRGMLYSELKGTYLHSAILPLLDPKMFTKIPNAQG